jgi:hypothetical protein
MKDGAAVAIARMFITVLEEIAASLNAGSN